MYYSTDGDTMGWLCYRSYKTEVQADCTTGATRHYRLTVLQKLQNNNTGWLHYRIYKTTLRADCTIGSTTLHADCTTGSTRQHYRLTILQELESKEQQPKRIYKYCRWTKTTVQALQLQWRYKSYGRGQGYIKEWLQQGWGGFHHRNFVSPTHDLSRTLSLSLSLAHVYSFSLETRGQEWGGGGGGKRTGGRRRRKKKDKKREDKGKVREEITENLKNETITENGKRCYDKKDNELKKKVDRQTKHKAKYNRRGKKKKRISTENKIWKCRRKPKIKQKKSHSSVPPPPYITATHVRLHSTTLSLPPRDPWP